MSRSRKSAVGVGRGPGDRFHAITGKLRQVRQSILRASGTSGCRTCRSRCQAQIEEREDAQQGKCTRRLIAARDLHRSRRAAHGRVANAEWSGPEGPLERLVFRIVMRNCDAQSCASRTSRSNGNGLRSQTSRAFRSGHSAQLRVRAENGFR